MLAQQTCWDGVGPHVGTGAGLVPKVCVCVFPEGSALLVRHRRSRILPQSAAGRENGAMGQVLTSQLLHLYSQTCKQVLAIDCICVPQSVPGLFSISWVSQDTRMAH